MNKYLKKITGLPVRKRIIISSLIVSIIFFIATTPIITWAIDFIVSPTPPTSVQVRTTGTGALSVVWSKPDSIDLKSIEIAVNQESIILDGRIEEYTHPKAEYPIVLSLQSIDIIGNRSNKVEYTITESQAGNADRIISIPDIYTQENNLVLRIIITLVVLGVTIFILTQFILLLPKKNIQRLVLALYPAFVLSPFLLFMLSLLVTESTSFGKFLLSFVFALSCFVVSYFVLLTTNILHTSIFVSIPLEQAARAAQFIFTLVSSYVVLILFFGAQYIFVEKVLFILPFIFFVSFSSIIMLPKVDIKLALIKTANIVLTILFAIFVMSIWPINYIYAILTIAVCFYIMLSISLEMRQVLTNYIWGEYGVLIALIIILLVLNSTWGINGTLI